MTFKIIPATVEHIPIIANIHFNELPNDFCSQLGIQFLTNIYYPFYFNEQFSMGYIAQYNQQVVGFALVAPAKIFYKKLIRIHFFNLAFYTLKTILLNPNFIFHIFDIMKLLISPNSFQPKTSDVELIYIAISKPFHKLKIGTQLIQQILDNLKKQNQFKRCIVKTLLKTPHTLSFYHKLNFVNVHEFHGRAWFVYTIINHE